MAELIHGRGDCLHCERLFGCLVTDGEMIFQVKDFSAKDGCWISQHQDSEGHLKELIPCSSVLCNWHFTSSSWAKLQTAGGLLEHFKTFLSRYFIAFLKINTRATHSPFCRHSERVSQGPFFSWWVSYSSKQNLCSDFSTAVGLNFISFFSRSLIVPLYQVNKCLCVS